ncbi:MAG: hypothetical protein E7472_06715 [Ruminococcaceae bacterium]|nr:hypothetical protein [Oscillospiraceae bacterium]
MMYDNRGLYIDEAHLENFAENYARSLKPDGAANGRVCAAELRRSIRKLDDLHDALSLKWSGISSMPGAVRWLLDNRYLLHREGAAAAADLSNAQQLRCAPGGTVLQLMCETLIRTGHFELTKERITLFLRGFQKTMILERDELNHLPAALCAAVITEAEKLYREIHCGDDSADPESDAARLFTALRTLGTTDLGKLIEQADIVEKTLRDDPAGIYPQMSDQSRSYYREQLARAARRFGIPEHTAAKKLLKLAESASGVQRHVGWWLLVSPLGTPPKKRSAGWYIAINVLASLIISLSLGFLSESPAVFLLLVIPVSELVKSTLDFLILRFSRPTHVPRLALKDGVPPDGRTLCVVSALLTDAGSAAKLTETLESTMLLSRDCGSELRYALLADLPDADCESKAEESALVQSCIAAIETLNRRYGGGFYLLTRKRTQNADGRWCGWERKRGALLETMRMLRGEESGMYVAAGSAQALTGTKYLLMLDSDTRVQPGAARMLIGAMLHPLNRPVIDSAKSIVTAGHAMLAPRVGVQLAAAGKSDFSRIFASQGGTDPYSSACSELYMDHFGRSSFAGKGIVDIDAYLQCLGSRVPDNTMLSHDAVEGSFLRSGFAGDIEFCDGFPDGVVPWLRRQERWIRGDWQNLPWLTAKRGKPLPQLEKWRLFDSVRRSLVPPSTAGALILGFFTGHGGLALCAAAALLALLAELLISLAEAALRREEERGIHYRSALFVGIGGALVRTFLRLILLPAEAWWNICAAARALWRMLISKRRMLQWQTAEQGNRNSRGIVKYYAEMRISALLAIVLIAFAPTVIGKTAGILWLLSPLCGLLLSLPAAAPLRLKRDEKTYLRSRAGETWQFFHQFLNEENHWLPPDNYQSRPPAGLARRTSPTNIGLALLSVLAAMDLGIADIDDGLDRIGKMLSTLKLLPKWNGHLYNWYSTETLQPLDPPYVSTVDSGNLCASLIALKNGLAEDYAAPGLAAQAAALAAEMEFAPLFDSEKRLFYIGIDPRDPKPPTAWYDLLASEARLTAYLAAARGDVPVESWRALSRALLQYRGYRGMASWTGTMFEYLMPELLLPLERNGLLWESARYCLYVQQKRVKSLKLPWGVSESAFWSLDPGMNYRYKAHGCAHLALKRGMDDELVISPYSSFIALAVRPHAAIANLRHLEKLGMRDTYGFWEALDCTAQRIGSTEPQPVRCVMAHHAGMSLVACANVLQDGKMRRRFLAEPAMRAYTGLLEERVPVGGSVIKKSVGAERRRPPQSISGSFSLSGEGTDFLHPQCCLLASSTYSLLVTESGITRPAWGAIAPYVSPRSPLDSEKGVELFLLSGGNVVSLLPDAYAGTQSGAWSWHFTSSSATVSAETGGFGTLTSVTLAETDIGERRHVVLQNTSAETATADLCMRLRPLLAREADYAAHPAFCSLGMSAKMKNGCLLLRRIARGATPELWMCIAPTRACRFDLSPGSASGRVLREKTADERECFMTEPIVTAVCPITLEPNESAETDFAIGLAYDEAGALAAAQHILKSSAADLPRTAATVIGMDDDDIAASFALLPALCFPTAPRSGAVQQDLWPHGISGDYPIVCAHYTGSEQLPAARKLMDRHLLLSGCGCDFDLVFLCSDSGSYHRPLHTALSDALWRAGGEVLRGAKGGVHILEYEKAAEAVMGLAAVTIDPLTAAVPDRPPRQSWRPALPGSIRSFPLLSPVRYEWSGSVFRFYTNRALPARAWQCMLTNGRFGYLATDCGTGHLWNGNAREMQLTPWSGRPDATQGPETLMLQIGTTPVSLFAEASDSACTVSFQPGAAVWEKRIDGVPVKTTAFVPPDTDARVLIIETQPPVSAAAALHWQMRLQLGSSAGSARSCHTSFSDGVMTVQCADAAALHLCASVPIEGRTCERAAALALDYNGAMGFTSEPTAALKLRPDAVTVLVCGCDAPEKLRALCSPDSARRALEKTLNHWSDVLDGFTLKSGKAALDRIMNHWCAYQVIAGRLYGRSSIYQSGGAFGFRDQLQDAVNLILLNPVHARAQILLSCTHQYTEGDVQHWWHDYGHISRGVRTRCSDDLLWLPWAVCEYVEKTGDLAVCSEQLPYLTSPVLSDTESDRYEQATPGDVRENVFRHCARALHCVAHRGCGPHGLLHIGSGDWNDGFSSVGGESVWLSWFFLHTAQRFSALCLRMGTEWDELSSFCERLRTAAERAWDGKWYLRGWYANGAPLGSEKSRECRIDSIAQSWAVFAGADSKKCALALQSAAEHLFVSTSDGGYIKLFDPPFAGEEHPGYIESYGPGFRENGGQYTHGALWLVMALLQSGERERAWEMLSAILPAGKSQLHYLCEPFVVAADVYSAESHEGEGGWSWYTGSAGWLLRVVTEELLGLRLREGKLYIEPNLPEALPGYSAQWHGNNIEVRSGEIFVNGAPWSGEGLERKIGNSSK